MSDVKKYTVTRKDRQKSLARMLSNTDTVKVGLTGGQKRALRDVSKNPKAGTAA